MTVEWETTTAGEAGFAENFERKFDAGLESGLLRDFHAVAFSRNGKLVSEHYFEGRDEAWGEDLGHMVFGPDTLHDLRSVTKSITSLLYGIALEQGLVPELDRPVVDGFPEYPDLVADSDRRKVTVEHTFNMAMGMEWDESLPYTDARNSEIMMEQAPDRYRFILDRPIIEPPGQRWIYSGGAVALIGALITRGTGQSLTDFARANLFEPLGIDAFFWCAGADGEESAASGLRLTTRGLLRIGDMLANGGAFGGRQVVPQSWIDACLTPAIQTSFDTGYSRLWYLETAYAPAFEGTRPWAGGFGNGGQRLWFSPSTGIAAVAYLGKYNDWSSWIMPTRFWHEMVMRNFERA
ncbi:serine hydrolase domain-containing protein [Devosia sp. CN2-171]|uniref:serine hydrolase domain-containing protein n=1 Tax=Devosia sp. CN2-171 TaxID=3400909 RepID=UPI003BF86574